MQPATSTILRDTQSVYSCEQCGKRFLNPSSLKRHQRGHRTLEALTTMTEQTNTASNASASSGDGAEQHPQMETRVSVEKVEATSSSPVVQQHQNVIFQTFPPVQPHFIIPTSTAPSSSVLVSMFNAGTGNKSNLQPPTQPWFHVVQVPMASTSSIFQAPAQPLALPVQSHQVTFLSTQMPQNNLVRLLSHNGPQLSTPSGLVAAQGLRLSPSIPVATPVVKQDQMSGDQTAAAVDTKALAKTIMDTVLTSKESPYHFSTKESTSSPDLAVKKEELSNAPLQDHQSHNKRKRAVPMKLQVNTAVNPVSSTSSSSSPSKKLLRLEDLENMCQCPEGVVESRHVVNFLLRNGVFRQCKCCDALFECPLALEKHVVHCGKIHS